MTTTNDVDCTQLMQLWDMLDLITPMAIRVAATLRVPSPALPRSVRHSTRT